MRRSKSTDTPAWMYVVVSLIVLSPFIIGSAIYNYASEETVVAEVIKTERVQTSKGMGKYLVFTTGETFQNTDTVWHGKFDSSDLHGQLKPGSYKFRVVGWRIPLLSVYRNIIEVEGGL